MLNRISCIVAALALAAPVGWAASHEQARELYLSGDLDGARAELEELLLDSDAEIGRADALQLLGQLEIDRKNWAAALEAWGELTDSYALSPQATSISSAIRLLQALVDCGCSAPEPTAVAAAAQTPPTVPAPESEATAAAEPASVPEPAPATQAAPRTAVEPAPGLFLVGGWGEEYEASQEVTRDLIEFLDANGVGVRAASTDVPAIRGVDVVLSYLLEEAEAAGAAGVILLTTRFDFREFILIERYDLDGRRRWKEKTTGGTALKERRDRGKPSWDLVERAKKRLADRIGTPGLPTR